MRRLFCLLVVCGSMLVSSVCWASVWNCTYEGAWVNVVDKDKGEFVWNVTWRSDGDGWTIFGEYGDKWGNSTFDGDCKKNVCNFSQKYTSGALKGKSYYWVGGYVEKSVGQGKVINVFNGTWGPSAKERKSGGPWNALATCVKK